MSDFIKNMTIARRSIVKQGKANGTITCPVCGNALSYTRAINYNDHIHAKCNTEKCLSWME